MRTSCNFLPRTGANLLRAESRLSRHVLEARLPGAFLDLIHDPLERLDALTALSTGEPVEEWTAESRGSAAMPAPVGRASVPLGPQIPPVSLEVPRGATAPPLAATPSLERARLSSLPRASVGVASACLSAADLLAVGPHDSPVAAAPASLHAYSANPAATLLARVIPSPQIFKAAAMQPLAESEKASARSRRESRKLPKAVSDLRTPQPGRARTGNGLVESGSLPPPGTAASKLRLGRDDSASSATSKLVADRDESKLARAESRPLHRTQHPGEQATRLGLGAAAIAEILGSNLDPAEAAPPVESASRGGEPIAGEAPVTRSEADVDWLMEELERRLSLEFLRTFGTSAG